MLSPLRVLEGAHLSRVLEGAILQKDLHHRCLGLTDNTRQQQAALASHATNSHGIASKNLKV